MKIYDVLILAICLFSIQSNPLVSAFHLGPLLLVAGRGECLHQQRLKDHRRLLLWPFRMSSSEQHSSSNGGGQLLVRAGQELHTAADSIGPKNYACPQLLKEVGDSLLEIGEYWTESWEAVTYAAEDASSAFHALAQLQQHPELAKLYSSSSNEFREIASIVGCTSIGPPTAVPNLQVLSENFHEAAKFVEKSGDDCCENTKAFGKSLRNASKSIKALAKEYQ